LLVEFKVLVVVTEDYDLLDCNAMYLGKSLLTFRRTYHLRFEEQAMQEASKPAVSFLLGILFDLQDGGSTLL
jgi:hypothetical protein